MFLLELLFNLIEPDGVLERKMFSDFIIVKEINDYLDISFMYLNHTLDLKESRQFLLTNPRQSAVEKESLTFVKCFYKEKKSILPETNWLFARDETGSLLQIEGFWNKNNSYKNVFFTYVQQETIQHACEQTLSFLKDDLDYMFFASDYYWSSNNEIWYLNENTHQKTIITFGASLTDTGNLYNFSQKTMPNDKSWYLGHFSNGLLWNEYLGQLADIPIHSWAFSASAGDKQYWGFVPSILEQVELFIETMDDNPQYNPKDMIVFLEFGINDFLNYEKDIDVVKKEFEVVFFTLIEHGIENLVLLQLPNLSFAPKFKYYDDDFLKKAMYKIHLFNQFLSDVYDKYHHYNGLNLQLLDLDILCQKTKNLFNYTNESVLDINQNETIDYFLKHKVREKILKEELDTYFFWEVTHPTTEVHRMLAEYIYQSDVWDRVSR